MKRRPTERSAAIAVIFRGGKFLVIQRSMTVRAPGKFCFPGGEVEKGEHFAEAVVRELDEELGAKIQPIRPLWQSVAPSGCVLNWIHVQLNDEELAINEKEVASVQWMTATELAEHPEVLPSNLEFLQAFDGGVFTITEES